MHPQGCLPPGAGLANRAWPQCVCWVLNSSSDVQTATADASVHSPVCPASSSAVRPKRSLANRQANQRMASNPAHPSAPPAPVLRALASNAHFPVIPNRPLINLTRLPRQLQRQLQQAQPHRQLKLVVCTGARRKHVVYRHACPTMASQCQGQCNKCGLSMQSRHFRDRLAGRSRSTHCARMPLHKAAA